MKVDLRKRTSLQYAITSIYPLFTRLYTPESFADLLERKYNKRYVYQLNTLQKRDLYKKMIAYIDNPRPIL